MLNAWNNFESTAGSTKKDTEPKNLTHGGVGYEIVH